MMTVHTMALRFLSQIVERPGSNHHPAIVWAHELCKMGQNVGDEVAWCSSILNLICWLLGKPRSLSAAARSWINPSLGTLRVGKDAIDFLLTVPSPGNIIVVFRRGPGRGQSDHMVLDASGHVAVYDRCDPTKKSVTVLGGNQSNAFTRATFALGDVIAVLQLA
jgi:hypothetical protein